MQFCNFAIFASCVLPKGGTFLPSNTTKQPVQKNKILAQNLFYFSVQIIAILLA